MCKSNIGLVSRRVKGLFQVNKKKTSLPNSKLVPRHGQTSQTSCYTCKVVNSIEEALNPIGHPGTQVKSHVICTSPPEGQNFKKNDSRKRW